MIWVTGLVAHFTHGPLDHPYALAYLLAIPAIAAVAGAVFHAARLTTPAALRVPLRAGALMALIWAGVLVVVFGALLVLRPEADVAESWLLVWAAASFAALAVERGLVWWLMRVLTRQGRLERRTAIVGGGAAGGELIQALADQPDSDLRLIGLFDDRNDQRSPEVVAGLPKLGTVTDLVAFARNTRIDLVIFALPITAEDRLLQMLRKLWVCRSTSVSRLIATSSGFGRAPIPTSATSPCSTCSTSRSPTGT